MKLKYSSVGKAMVRVWEIESRLGKERSDPVLNIIKVNKMVAALEAELAAMPVPKPATLPPVAAPPKPPPPVFNRQQCESIMGEVFHESRLTFAQLSDAALLEDTVARIAAAHLLCPGVQSAAHTDRPRGYAAIIHGARQDALNRTLEGFNHQRK